MCLQIMTCSCFAQWQITAAAQLGKMSVMDRDFSAAPFSAWLPGAAVSVRYERPHSIQSLAFSYLGGSLRTSTSPSSTLGNDLINADYSFLYKLGAAGTAWSGGIGGSLLVLYDSRNYKDFINNNTSFDFVASAAAAGGLAYHFDNGYHGWSIAEQLSIPLVSWLIQPPYGNETSSASPSGAGNRNSVTGFSGFFRLKNCLSLEKQLSPGSQLSLAWCWNYYKIKDIREVQEADHRLGLIFRLTL